LTAFATEFYNPSRLRRHKPQCAAGAFESTEADARLVESSIGYRILDRDGGVESLALMSV